LQFQVICQKMAMFDGLNAPLTTDRRDVKRPPPPLVFHGLLHGTTLEKKCVAQNLTY
jgi:hypothetical protein